MPLTRVIRHARTNAIAYLALFVALGGTSYAAIGLGNHSINPVKLNPRYIGGYVRAWVSVNARGKVTASGGTVRVIPDPDVAPGHYIIDWRPRPTSRCEATGAIDIGNRMTPGVVLAQTAASKGQGEQSAVQTFTTNGQPAALPYDLQLICSTPR